MSALSPNISLLQNSTNNTSSDLQQKIQILEQQKMQLQNQIKQSKQDKSLDEEARRKKIEELKKRIEKINEQIRKLKQSNNEDKNTSPKTEIDEKKSRDPYSPVGRVVDKIV
ncbi:FlxA-like family protein [Halocella sp. SP3-1]|uniref:FlxA-like family protein n=1 Tax=Halocella sp. SP3-1 TaxID=2382161 RepID=UPI00197AFA07|nr:FlxA-like family protein [Halocella sp. SP3-1]